MIVTSWSLPSCIVPPSAKNKSENSAEAEPSVAPSALEGTSDVPTVPVFMTGLVKVLFVSVDVEASDTSVESPPVLGIVKLLVAPAECGQLLFAVHENYFHN